MPSSANNTSQHHPTPCLHCSLSTANELQQDYLYRYELERVQFSCYTFRLCIGQALLDFLITIAVAICLAQALILSRVEEAEHIRINCIDCKYYACFIFVLLGSGIYSCKMVKLLSRRQPQTQVVSWMLLYNGFCMTPRGSQRWSSIERNFSLSLSLWMHMISILQRDTE